MCLVANAQRSVHYPANAKEIGKGARAGAKRPPDFQWQYEEKGKANARRSARRLLQQL
jgi:hypothetical protein